MSCSLAIQFEKEFYIAVDTAESTVDLTDSNPLIYRCKDKRVEKIRKYGQDLAFICGAYPCVNYVTNEINNLLGSNEHINIDLLQKYLIEKYPKDKSVLKDTAFSEVSVVVYQVINNITRHTALEQYNNFKIDTKITNNQNIELTCNGIHNNVVGGYALGKLNEAQKPFLDIMLDAFKENYCEAVGNSVIIYHLNSNGSEILGEIQLNESNLKYAEETINTKKNIFNSLLQGASGTFTGAVRAGEVIGSRIEGSEVFGSKISGGEIYGTKIEGATITGSKINSIGEGAGYLSKTQIEEGYIHTHYLKVSPMNVNTKDFSPDSWGYLGLSPSQVYLTKDNIMNINITADGTIQALDVKTNTINGSLPITFGNMLEYLADKEHTHPSNTIKPVLTSGGNVGLNGINVASVNYCNQTYATTGSLSSLESRVAALEKK